MRAREADQLGNDQLGAVDPAGPDSFGELGSISVLSALNLHKLLHQANCRRSGIRQRRCAATSIPMAQIKAELVQARDDQERVGAQQQALH